MLPVRCFRKLVAAKLLTQIGSVPAVYGLIPAIDLHRLPVIVSGHLFGVVLFRQRFAADIHNIDPVAERNITPPHTFALRPDGGAVLPVGGKRVQQILAGDAEGGVTVFVVIIQLCRFLRT